MSIKRILILFLSIAILLSVLVFAFVSSRQVDQYFSGYIDEVYQKNVEDIKGYVTDGLKTGYLHKATLLSYIEDPIYYAAVYNTEGELVIDSEMATGTMMSGGMMNGMMGGGRMDQTFNFDAAHMTSEEFVLADNGATIGTLLIIREKNTVNTETSRLFRTSLLSSGLISLAVTIVIAGAMLFVIIRTINRGVRDMVDYAQTDEGGMPTYKISELNIIASSIDSYRKKLAQKERVKKQKLDKVLHDTKTPLTILKSQLEGVQDGLIKTNKPIMQTLLNNVDALSAALEDITDVVEGQEKAEQVRLFETDYAEELIKLVRSLEAKFRDKGLKLELKTDRLTIKTNPAVLNKAVYNLLLNSYKYTKTGGAVITTDQEAKTLSIKDTGIGIPSDELDKVFEPYYRGKNARAVEGEGLGLLIVKEQLLKMNADVLVRSEPGKYTEFIIKF